MYAPTSFKNLSIINRSITDYAKANTHRHSVSSHHIPAPCLSSSVAELVMSPLTAPLLTIPSVWSTVIELNPVREEVGKEII